MTVTLVHVHVKPEFVGQFIDATRKNHEHSIKEPGNLRFDILQDEKDRCKFILYEAYVSSEAAATHKETPHYFEWRDAVANWMASPREGVKYRLLFPDRK